ncbi:hypothetical protein D5F01_LYC02246 [Larimichthys crocea]|uniref:Uncharacterized protein n=1 Tax=Larimichthys crocea TaxID=215358 RepID=A0A6G0J7V7_LARCR|nr:hypothetical protein D5F01_LYC02246 [Larimichthys crocea]
MRTRKKIRTSMTTRKSTMKESRKRKMVILKRIRKKKRRTTRNMITTSQTIRRTKESRKISKRMRTRKKITSMREAKTFSKKISVNMRGKESSSMDNRKKKLLLPLHHRIQWKNLLEWRRGRSAIFHPSTISVPVARHSFSLPKLNNQPDDVFLALREDWVVRRHLRIRILRAKGAT